MLILVLALAVVGLAVLATAILTGNTILALVVIAVAALGLLLLTRAWWKDRRRPRDAPDEADAAPAGDQESGQRGIARQKRALEPDQFEPDVSMEEAEEAEHHGAGGATE
ncbi:MAG: hypothetical protein JO044_13580 [Mycobacteriaceae bacterium]|nr:hypothetical protein [Mycobacteriaceae bacterium]MBV9638606.1 hypothetical protein [Mycobacteriaceae bacterium]